MPAANATTQDRPRKGSGKKSKKTPYMVGRYIEAEPGFTERMAAGRTNYGMVDEAAIQQQRQAEAKRAIDEFDLKWKEASSANHKSHQ
ncbi:hypothetical protein PG989_004425 [Apiospora arundinis]